MVPHKQPRLSGRGCDTGKRPQFRHGTAAQKNQPLTEPTVSPLMKYFWKKG